uniref:Uncharacterized protein n=1 Tax=Romanomermis culicivorax TaxID=13658 RepID=A0A915KV21_ROMCU
MIDAAILYSPGRKKGGLVICMSIFSSQGTFGRNVCFKLHLKKWDLINDFVATPRVLMELGLGSGSEKNS